MSPDLHIMQRRRRRHFSMAENALISDAVSHCVRGYWAVTHALRRQPQPTDSAARGARVRQALAAMYGVGRCCSSLMVRPL